MPRKRPDFDFRSWKLRPFIVGAQKRQLRRDIPPVLARNRATSSLTIPNFSIFYTILSFHLELLHSRSFLISICIRASSDITSHNMEFCAEDEVKVESPDFAIWIGGGGGIIITNPLNIITITIGQLLAEIFRKPQGYDALWEHLHRGDPARAVKRTSVLFN